MKAVTKVFSEGDTLTFNCRVCGLRIAATIGTEIPCGGCGTLLHVGAPRTFGQHLEATWPRTPQIYTLFRELRDMYNVGGYMRALDDCGDDVQTYGEVGQLLLIVFALTLNIQKDKAAWQKALATIIA